MSPLKSSNSRKRRHYFDSSESSDDDDETPIKFKKCNERATFITRMRQLMTWVAELGVNKYFLNTVKMGSSIPVTLIDDDDEINEDDEVVIVDEVKNNKKGKPNPFYDRTTNRYAFINGSRRRQNSMLSDSFAYPTNGFSNLTLASTPISRNNGFRNRNHEVSLNPYATDEAVNGISKLSSPEVLAPISNPDTDVQILTDTHKKPSSDIDDVAVLSKISDSNPSASRSKKISKNRTVHGFSNSSAYSKKRISDDKEEIFPMPNPVSCLGNPYTAHEVIRLQEKKQYQQLLDKYMKNQFYQPVKKTVQDVELDSKNELVNLEHCSNKVLHQPVDSYLQMYYEPFKSFGKSSDSSLEQDKSDTNSESSDVCEIDDDVTILKVSLPKYKLKYDHKPDFSDPEWLSHMQAQILAQTEERKKLEVDHMKVLEELRKERLRKQIMKAIAPQKEQARKSIEIPEITPEMNAVIERALNRPLMEKISQSKSGTLTRKDLETLVGLNWLNDEVINYYMSLIVERSEKNEKYPRIYAYSTFFYPTLKTRGFLSVKRWTRKVDIFSYDMLLVPLHLDIHWALAVIYPAKKKIEYYDSMGSGELSCFGILSDYLVSELKDKKGQVESSEYCVEKMDAPIQMNGSDCGMFTLKYAEYISRNAFMNFDQANIPYFRKRMIYELLTNTLL